MTQSGRGCQTSGIYVAKLDSRIWNLGKLKMLVDQSLLTKACWPNCSERPGL